MDEPALELARQLAERFIPFAALAAEKPGEDNELADLSLLHIFRLGLRVDYYQAMMVNGLFSHMRLLHCLFMKQ